MTPVEISDAITSARAIGEMCKGLLRLHIDSEARDAVIDAQTMSVQLLGQMLDISARFEEQSTELNELRDKLKSYANFDANASKYELRELFGRSGLTAYHLKDAKTSAEANLIFCAYCFGNRKLVILQDLYCPECKHKLPKPENPVTLYP